MCKIRIILIAAVCSLTAQTVTGQALMLSKFRDNWFVGANGGVSVPLSSFNPGNTLEPQLGLRTGRWLTPYFALGAEGQAYIGQSGHFSVSRTAVNVWNASLLGIFNVNNIVSGYTGKPRVYEVMSVIGIGGAGLCGAGWKYVPGAYDDPHPNSLTASFALNLVRNFGKHNQWQGYIEPKVNYELANENKNVKFQMNRALFSLNVGFSYYFLNTNGSHHSKYIDIPSVEKVATLSSQMDSLRSTQADELAQKDKQIAQLQQTILNINHGDTIIQHITLLQPVVIFRQGKDIIDPAQFAPIEQIARYMNEHPTARVTIRGYASPEGNAAQNQRLSEYRAENVRNALVKKYGIDITRLTYIGCGVTDKMFRDLELNRLVTFSQEPSE